MIKCTEKNANTSHTRSQLELKVKACLEQIKSINYKILYKQEKKKKENKDSAASLERRSSVLFCYTCTSYSMLCISFNSTLKYTGEANLTT